MPLASKSPDCAAPSECSTQQEICPACGRHPLFAGILPRWDLCARCPFKAHAKRARDAALAAGKHIASLDAPDPASAGERTD